MRSEMAVRGLFVALFALTLYLMYRIFLPFLAGIAWAVVLAVAFQPVYTRLVTLARGRTWLAAVTLSLAVATLIVVPATIVVVKAGQGVAQGYEWLRQAGQQEGGLEAALGKMPWLKDATEFVGRYVDLETIDVKGMALSAVQTIGDNLAGKTADFVKNAVSTLVNFVVLLVTMTVLFHEGPAFGATVMRFLPLGHADRDEVVKEMRDVTRSVFFGVLMTALVQGTLGGIGTAIAGLPAPFTFGAAMFFGALLPAGTALVWGPAAIYLLVTGHPWAALFLAAWGVLVVSMVDNLLRPLFIGRGVRMHGLLVFFGTFGGLLAFGLVGLFLGPLIITFFLFLVEVARRDMFREAGGTDVMRSGPSEG